MSKLLLLKSAQTLTDVATLLGFSASGLSYVLYKQPDAEKYAKFEIDKKSGGKRLICAPKGALKAIQRELATLLNECREELNEKAPRRPISHGFRKQLSIITNAQNHKNRRYVFNLDLVDFFPTFNFGRVRGFFIKDHDFALSEKVATVLAQIACFENALPQGSPCSPVIADMIAHLLDVRLVQLAKKYGVTYSRYADDLTFSTNQKVFPEVIAASASETENLWLPGASLITVIESAGFAINPSKTRMHLRISRQMVTGLTVNDKVNISQPYWRAVRSMCHSLYETGEYYLPPGKNSTGEPAKISKLEPLAGMLSHVYNVKKRSGHLPKKDKNGTDLPDIVFGHTDHQRFWFYKTFVAPNRPIILCEGTTDNIYLRNAIRQLSAAVPVLGAKTPDGFKFAIALFSYTNTVHKILDIKGGDGALHSFIHGYRKCLHKYRMRPLTHPVIVLFDNDSALDGKKCKSLKKNFGVDITHASTEPFFHLTDNLYLVKTPLVGVTSPTSCIEDLFDDATKKKPLNGKTFYPEKDGFDEDIHIGKARFATKVVAPNATSISWVGFTPLLDRIAAVLADYPAKMLAAEFAPSSPALALLTGKPATGV